MEAKCNECQVTNEYIKDIHGNYLCSNCTYDRILHLAAENEQLKATVSYQLTWLSRLHDAKAKLWKQVTRSDLKNKQLRVIIQKLIDKISTLALDGDDLRSHSLDGRLDCYPEVVEARAVLNKEEE